MGHRQVIVRKPNTNWLGNNTLEQLPGDLKNDYPKVKGFNL
ncbi:hypothetical protein M068_3789 [Bacteroides fragilis str. J38-1]|nr:hypothetical protein M068_3789 [Bacteroides fragilis str. J38-1]